MNMSRDESLLISSEGLHSLQGMPSEEQYLEEGPRLIQVPEHLPGTSALNELTETDNWNNQLPDKNQWDLYPLREGVVPKNREPMLWENFDDVGEPSLLIQNAEFIYQHYHLMQNESSISPPLVQSNRDDINPAPLKVITTIHTVTQEDHNAEDHDCPICNAAKPKPLIKPDQSVVIGDSSESQVAAAIGMHNNNDSGFD